jgi:DNA-binding winged helix-turn-helix (wHTH) protein
MSTQLSTPLASQKNSTAQPVPSWPARYASFGKFVLDLHGDELYQDGRRTRVQGKVLQALLVLLSHAGEIVTREEVRQRLWPESFLVNLDANVNTAMNKLRQVLGDSSDNPIYIETIPRRGYCFIAAVEFSDVVRPQRPNPTDATGRPARLGIAETPLHTPDLMSLAFRGLTVLVAGIVLGALLMIAWSFFSERNHSRVNANRETASRSVIVASLRE